MSPELMQALCALVVVYGLALSFYGYRLFRAGLAMAGLALGVWIGLILTAELRLDGLARWLIVAGVSLGAAALAVAVYYVGVFIAGGAVVAGGAQVVAIRMGRPMPHEALGVIFLLAGGVVLMLHRRLLIDVTAFGGGLLVVAGLAPLVQGAAPPGRFEIAWLQSQLATLPVYWLGIGLGIGLLGAVAQHRTEGRGLRLVSARAESSPGGEPSSRARRGGGSSRTHGAVCPRCGGVVDPDALACHHCGNDRWG